MTNITNTASLEQPAPSFRDVMGAFCSGIVIVSGQGSDPLGFTCQSFTSLSFDPSLISINPARTSSSWPRIRRTGAFGINILAHDQRHLSETFARSGNDKFATVNWREAANGVPIIEGVHAWVACELWEEFDGGDHTIVVGRVVEMDVDTVRQPLLYHRGAYKEATS